MNKLTYNERDVIRDSYLKEFRDFITHNGFKPENDYLWCVQVRVATHLVSVVPEVGVRGGLKIRCVFVTLRGVELGRFCASGTPQAVFNKILKMADKFTAIKRAVINE